MSRRYGVSVGTRGLTAVPRDGATHEAVHVNWTLPVDRPGRRSTVRAGFRELGDRLTSVSADADPPAGATQRPTHRDASTPATRISVTLAILPPLVESKLLELPPLPDDTAARVVQRDAARHFLDAKDPMVVGIESFPGGGDSGPRIVLAGAMPRPLADALYDAVEAVGWTLDGIVPAHSAWICGLDRSTGARGLVAMLDETVYVLRFDGRHPVSLRRAARSDAEPTAISKILGSGPGSVRVLGPAGPRQAVETALAEAGWRSDPDRAGPSAPIDAADRAHRARGEVVPARLAMARRDRTRRIGVRMGVGAVALLVAAALVQLWGADRQLDRVRDERAELRPAVAPLLTASDSLLAMEERLASIEALEREGSGWTLALVELSVILPDDVYLVGIQAAGDTLVLDAVGSRAGDAVDALSRAAGFRDIRLEGPIQRDVEEGETARERFTLSALRTPEAYRTEAPLSPAAEDSQ